MTNEEAIKVILSDIDSAKTAKKDIDNKIDTWLNEFEGNPYGNETKGRSKIVVKDIKKAVEWFVPTASDPFVKKPRIVKLEGITAEDVQSAKMHERLLNYQFIRKFDSYTFIHDLFKVSSTEGTVIVRCGWNYKEDEKSESFEGLTPEEVLSLEGEDVEIKDVVENPDGTVDLTVIRRKVMENNPTAEVLKNGNCFPDPQCTTIEDANFFAYRYESTMSELRASGKYEEDALEDILASVEKTDSSLEASRESRNREYGQDENYESSAEANKKVTVYEYWGHLDLNDDGISEPIVATVVNKKLLDIDDNPYPDQCLPFVGIPFSTVPFAFWGNPLAEFLSDNQKVRTSLMRGFIDNVAQSNNGKKYVKKGAMDAINRKKHETNVGGIIEINGDKNDFFEGEFNSINPSVYNLYELVQQEAEALSGINRTMQGIDSRGLNDSATGASIQQSNSQRRMMDVVRRHSNGLKKIFRKWISYNKEFLTDDEVMRISGEYIPFKRDDISGEFDIDITVGTDGITEAKVNQMTMLMQQVGGLAGVASIPPQFFNLMLSKMADEWGYPDIAQMLENPEPEQPNEAQQEMARLEMEEKKGKIELDKAKAIQAMSDSNSKNVSTKKSALGIVDPK
jgi:hypothetical protein